MANPLVKATLAVYLACFCKAAFAQIPNQAPDAIGVMPDSIGVYYSDSTTDSVTTFNGVDTDAAQDGEFLTTPSGKWWCQREPGADEINLYLKNPRDNGFTRAPCHRRCQREARQDSGRLSLHLTVDFMSARQVL